MSGGKQPVGEDDLQAWVDGQLAPDREPELARWFEQHPAEAARARAFRADRDRLRALLAPKAEETVPARLLAASAGGARPSHNRRWAPLLRLAAACVLLLAGCGIGWVLRGATETPQALLAADAIQAHLTFVTEVRHPVEVRADQEAHLVAWLSNRLGRTLRVPDLSGFGFHLVGGRLLPGEAAAAAQFMFENGSEQRLTLYLRQEPEGGAGFEVVQRAGVTGFRWFEGGFGYVLLATEDRQRLLAMAEAVYRQLPGA